MKSATKYWFIELCYPEYMRIYVLEAITRAAEQAKKEDCHEVTLDHLEKILPQFLLDFAWSFHICSFLKSSIKKSSKMIFENKKLWFH